MEIGPLKDSGCCQSVGRCLKVAAFHQCPQGTFQVDYLKGLDIDFHKMDPDFPMQGTGHFVLG